MQKINKYVLVYLRFVIKILTGSCVILLVFLYKPKTLDKYNLHKNYQIQPDVVLSEIHYPNTQSQKDKTNKNKNTNQKQTTKKEQKDNKHQAKQLSNSVIAKEVGEKHLSDGFEYTQSKYDQICKGYKNICSITKFQGDFKMQDKLIYQALVVFLIDNIDSFLSTEDKLIDTVYSIRFTDKKDRRGYAGHHTIVINVGSISSYKETFEVLTHELGHIIDLGIIKGEDGKKDPNFTEFGQTAFYKTDSSLQYYSVSRQNENTRRGDANKQHFVSGYGMNDPFEDFAESINMYLNHYTLFQKMAQNNTTLHQKFVFISKIFNENYIFSDNSNLEKLQENSKRRPWDSTKI